MPSLIIWVTGNEKPIRQIAVVDKKIDLKFTINRTYTEKAETAAHIVSVCATSFISLLCNI
jgi:hypothetical protein